MATKSGKRLRQLVGVQVIFKDKRGGSYQGRVELIPGEGYVAAYEFHIKGSRKTIRLYANDCKGRHERTRVFMGRLFETRERMVRWRDEHGIPLPECDR